MLAEKLKFYFLFFISGSTLNVSFVQKESVKACYHKSRINVNFFNQSQTLYIFTMRGICVEICQKPTVHHFSFTQNKKRP